MIDAITAWIVLSVGQAIAANDARLEAYARLNRAAAVVANTVDEDAPPSAAAHARPDPDDGLVVVLLACVPLLVFALFGTGVAIGVRCAKRDPSPPAGGRGKESS